MAVKPGDILRDTFRVDGLIGRGGMGQVFAATTLDTREQVAIKVVSRLVVDDVLMMRLYREAEAAQRIRSDFVPRVLEVSSTEEGETFLVMERLVGEPLSQRIRQGGALAWSEVSQIGEDVLRGLIDAHTAGVIHRDLKPSNVFLAQKAGRVRAMVLDFGVCKMDGVDAQHLTGTGESIGTVAYMAPEQIRGAARVDERADLYAFGVLVFEMLTGRLPHEGPTQMAILASKLEKPAASLRDSVRVTIPEGTDALVTRALERDPAGRFASAQQLLKAWRSLARAAGPLPIEAELPLLARAPLPLDPHPTQTALTTQHTAIHRSGGGRMALVLAACGLVAGVVVVGLSFTRAPARPQSAAAPAVAAALTSTASIDLYPEEEAGEAPSEPEEALGPASFELPADPPPADAPVKQKPAHVRRSKAPLQQAPKGPRITAQPRY